MQSRQARSDPLHGISMHFAVTLSSLASSCVLFDIAFDAVDGAEMATVQKQKRWLLSSRVKFPFVSMSASWFLSKQRASPLWKIIRAWNCSGSPILLMNFWTSWTSCKVVDPVKIFHSNSIGSLSIVSKILHCDESLNHPNCRSQTAFDVGF